ILGGVVIVAGFSFGHDAFAAALQAREGRAVVATDAPPLSLSVLLPAPAMLLAVSRLMFAWAEDGIFPRRIAAVHPRFRTPHVAILASAGMATLGIIGSHVAGDFFLGVDILVNSMLVNFLLMAVSVLT